MPTRKQLEEANRVLAAFDWSTIDAMSDEDIIAAAKADPDSALPSEAELAEYDLVIPAKSRRAFAKDAAE